MYANTCVEPLPEAKRIAVEGLGMPMYPQLDAEKPKPVVEQMQAVLQSFSLEGIQP
jgi:dTDP-4-amino-4,6-dideoxygalactose transaminase